MPQTLVDIMTDKTQSASARVRCAELILERGHGKPAQPQEQTGGKIIPLAERLAYYARRDEIEASGGKAVTLVP